MGRKSRDKGRRGELAIARRLSSWWMQDEALLEARAVDLPIRRTPMSGGWARAKGIGGDLVPVKEEAEDFVFSVEVKNREDWSFDQLLKAGSSWVVYREWWDQCVQAAEEAGLVPFLLFTKKNAPWYFRLALEDWTALWCPAGFPDLGFEVLFYGEGVYGLLDDFVRRVRKEYCLEAFHGRRRN